MKQENKSSKKKKGKKEENNEEKLMQAVPGYAHARDSLMQVNATENRLVEQPNAGRSVHVTNRSPSKLSIQGKKELEVLVPDSPLRK